MQKTTLVRAKRIPPKKIKTNLSANSLLTARIPFLLRTHSCLKMTTCYAYKQASKPSPLNVEAKGKNATC